MTFATDTKASLKACSILFGLTVLLSTSNLSAGLENSSMEKIHAERPEVEQFLPAAQEEMIAYHTENGVYPGEWHMMDITYACGPYRMTDPDVRPTVEMANRWKPRDCYYIYEIISATSGSFKAQAVDDDGNAVFEIGEEGGLKKLPQD
jgi:hypothetical protein